MEKPQSHVPSTTYVQADANSFRELVQRLTGPIDETRRAPPTSPPPPAEANHGTSTPASATTKVAGIKRPASKLQERRQCPRSSNLVIPKPSLQAFELGFSTATAATKNPGGGMRSPSPPRCIQSPLTSPSTNFADLSILEGENSASLELNEEEEERAIRERRFYLHPSPRSGPRNIEPELLPLFPLTSTPTDES